MSEATQPMGLTGGNIDPPRLRYFIPRLAGDRDLVREVTPDGKATCIEPTTGVRFASLWGLDSLLRLSGTFEEITPDAAFERLKAAEIGAVMLPGVRL